MHIEVDEPTSYLRLLTLALFKRGELDSGDDIPFFSLKRSTFRFNKSQHREYCTYFGFDTTTVPLPFLFVATQSEQLMLFTHPNVVVKPLGLVHTEVAFNQTRPLAVDDSYEFRLYLSDQRHTDRGVWFEVTGEFYFQGCCVASYKSGYLIPNKTQPRGRSSSDSQQTTVVIDESTRHLDTLTLTVTSSRAYAKLSGDYNPIHLSKTLSRLFGFRSPIIHGMHMVAKTYLLMLQQGDHKNIRFTFKRPILLPQTITCFMDSERIIWKNKQGKELIIAISPVCHPL
ncbi:hypothetical protein BCU70_01495 [Vibrio sp. 10N.286.49.C2]|uniref:MaoC/PaaZ C-terminal domain-containing protein n=1 Tax=unclassified Vibrio TaxID=2614977 RepID=UPI000C847766|nr:MULTISPECIES: MaoC/PaaZ C-terminal domain-containing protein [unclassified Vibrio]PMH42859.1 hypothetical protein BCU70_01495 [Vibrio sp. 10N.286.49.C2]PMH53802.1 hypothetical protein BCU66_13340 [Vibrio sp. 10N.286.49.B1]PMH79789.1 hypothetical protein BCU58_04380 [Vibrio sp. 10N.286.48.B7]